MEKTTETKAKRPVGRPRGSSNTKTRKRPKPLLKRTIHRFPKVWSKRAMDKYLELDKKERKSKGLHLDEFHIEKEETYKFIFNNYLYQHYVAFGKVICFKDTVTLPKIEKPNNTYKMSLLRPIRLPRPTSYIVDEIGFVTRAIPNVCHQMDRRKFDLEIRQHVLSQAVDTKMVIVCIDFHYPDY